MIRLVNRKFGNRLSIYKLNCKKIGREIIILLWYFSHAWRCQNVFIIDFYFHKSIFTHIVKLVSIYEAALTWWRTCISLQLNNVSVMPIWLCQRRPSTKTKSSFLCGSLCMRRALLRKAKRQYLLTCKVSRYCLLALRGRALPLWQSPPRAISEFLIEWSPDIGSHWHCA